MRNALALPALLGCVLLGFAFAPQTSRAQPAGTKVRVAQPEFTGYEKGSAFSSRGESYVVLTEVHAVQAASAEEADSSALIRVGLVGASVMQRKGVHVLYRTPAGTATNPEASLIALPGAVARPVVLNTRTGQLGIVLGTIIAKLHNPADTEDLALKYGVQIQADFKHLSMAVFAVKPGRDVAAAAQQLQADSRVESADVEVIEQVAVPN